MKLNMNKIKHDILIIGDSHEDIKTTIKIFQNLGHNTYTVASLENLSEYLLSNPPSIIYFIVKEQNKLFFSILTSIDQHNILHKIPKIIIGSEKEKIKKQFQKLNIANYITFPVNATTLRKTNTEFFNKNYGHNYLFKDTRRLKATMKGDLVKINEISALLLSSVKFNNNQQLEINSKFLVNKLGFDNLRIQIFRGSRLAETKSYYTELVLLGLREKNTMKIRGILKT